MKIKFFYSILSCIQKCIGFLQPMSRKKLLYGIIVLNFLGACTTPTAMIGPVYTLGHTGNIYQAGLTFGSNKFVNMYTGKTTIENLKEITIAQNKELKNIQKQTLESDEFYHLVKGKMKKTRDILKFSNQ